MAAGDLQFLEAPQRTIWSQGNDVGTLEGVGPLPAQRRELQPAAKPPLQIGRGLPDWWPSPPGITNRTLVPLDNPDEDRAMTNATVLAAHREAAWRREEMARMLQQQRLAVLERHKEAMAALDRAKAPQYAYNRLMQATSQEMSEYGQRAQPGKLGLDPRRLRTLGR